MSDHDRDCPARYACCPIGEDRDCMIHSEPPCNCDAEESCGIDPRTGECTMQHECPEPEGPCCRAVVTSGDWSQHEPGCYRERAL